MTGLSIEDGIKQVFNGLSHVVILGAGASIASTLRNPEPSGKILPSMDNFIVTVGLNDIIGKLAASESNKNFESIYSKLHHENPDSPILHEIEERIMNYFASMTLPEEPTIYDYMVMSLRQKDLIATFNWDPFLFHAWCRIREYTDDVPHLSFLHVNVAIGFDLESKRCGPVGMQLRRDGGLFHPTKLLYPVKQKNYSQDPLIDIEWQRVRAWLDKEASNTVRLTVFGYGAPASDVEAMKLLNDAYGTSDDRAMEQFEIIDHPNAAPEELTARWHGFVHSHHYDVCKDYFESSLANNPRRSCESYHSHNLPFKASEAFRNNNLVPTNFKTLDEMWEWHRPMIDAEKQTEAAQAKQS